MLTFVSIFHNTVKFSSVRLSLVQMLFLLFRLLFVNQQQRPFWIISGETGLNFELFIFNINITFILHGVIFWAENLWTLVCSFYLFFVQIKSIWAFWWTKQVFSSPQFIFSFTFVFIHFSLLQSSIWIVFHHQ